ncbi:Tim44 domain-containing protein [Azospirillum thermophilum]|uniref:Tim44-like domain-containing protein n=1 Tax=Azospirillum thermophilum TaxID=2202148 RepID=A0A2S2CT05_9PROT|nr:Tim44 domain-containing protein [Azospirillum thermophilum]AWK87632.1 hypothetical protein DEW08_16690 [Azospirillum thermophilum]
MTDRPRSSHSAARSPARALTAVAVALCVALAAGTADARAGSSSSSGSRGSKTYSAPPPTNTAPSTAAPMERSMAPAQQPGMQRPTAPTQAPAQSGGFFRGGGFMSGLMGGLIGAGIGAMLFGGGFFDGLGSFAGILGFLLQVLLIVFLVRLAIRFFRNRSGQPAGAMGGAGPAYAGGPATLNRDPADVRYNPLGGGPLGGGPLGGSGPGGAPGQPRDELGVQPADFDAFERLLGQVQAAYGQEDLNALRQLATPEMVSYFAGDLAQNSSRGIVNRVSDPRLLQGDLAEAWREGAMEYATVAMRFSIIDTMVERATGRVVEGDPSRPVEVTELWTFARSRGGNWLLSAIQQTR